MYSVARTALACAAALTGSGVAVGLAAPAAHAGTTITVNTTADDEHGPIGQCTLRDAITAANNDTAVDTCPAGSGSDTIIVPAGTYAPTNDYPPVSSTMAIIGAGSTTVVRPSFQFQVAHGGSATMSKLTIDGGYFPVENQGTLNMADMTVRNGTGPDGAIDNGGTLTIVTSTLTRNRGWTTGGILNEQGGSVIAVNDTITGNTARWPSGYTGPIGAAVHNRGGTFRGRNLTITGNTATGVGQHDASQTGGVLVHGGTVELANSIVAGNKLVADPGGPGDCANLGQLHSLGFNLIGSKAGCTIGGTTTGNINGQAPKLGPLANNGGPTQTMMLLPGSPAIDHGNPASPGQQPALCPLLDQRGIARPRDGNGDGTKRCDIGAIER